MKKVALFSVLCAVASVLPPPLASADEFVSTTNVVAHTGADLITPVNQLVTPAGRQVDLPGHRPEAIALSPDGKLLVTAGLGSELLVLDPATGQTRQEVEFPVGDTPGQAPITGTILAPDEKSQMSFNGLRFSPDGTRLYLANMTGDIKVFQVDPTGQIAALRSLPLPATHLASRANDLPTGLAVSPEGLRLYVALNFSDRLAELDSTTGKLLRIWNVGSAPFDVALIGRKVYVSNWGGRRPTPGDITAPSGLGSPVRADAHGVASEGSISVIDLDQPATDAVVREIVLGRHTSALAVSPELGWWASWFHHRWLVAANTGDDTLSLIDPRSDTVVETVSARQNPADLFGAQPNALAFSRSGERLYVCNGTQNAVAVFHFNPGHTELLGLIPVGWFPSGVVVDAARHQLDVANIKSLPRQPEPSRQTKGIGFNTHQYTGSLSLVPIPARKDLPELTSTALRDLRYPMLLQTRLPARTGQPAQPVPERTGEPSVFHHVIYIIKENRTYDQVLGDLPQGNGDASLCNFGQHVTPNLHRLATEFTLLDNTYCGSILSADGHNWADAAMATDYIEREFAGWPRSYPAGGAGKEGTDALAFSPAGFIWDNALAHGRSVVDFGEYSTATKKWKDPTRKTPITCRDCYRDYTNGVDTIDYSYTPDIASLGPLLAPGYIGWDLDVPDVWRERQFERTFQQYVAHDNLPGLVIVWLPNDHTSGTKPGEPTPAAQVADNDLAVGRLVDAVSHSKYWADTCIFSIEDDPQNGWDHVSGYRTTAFVASAYTRRHAVVSTQYNQTSLLRTMELMLGLPPMNQMDATATPMFDCFTNTPDMTPFTAVANETPLDQYNGHHHLNSQLHRDEVVSAGLRLARPDQCPEDVLNRILWRATMGTERPYPEWAVKPVPDND